MVNAKMIAHLLGNGASYTLYTPQQGTIIGFNVPKHNWHVDYIVILDTMANRAMSKQDIKPRATVWCHTDVLEQAQHNKHYPEMFDPVFGDKDARPRRYNGGHAVVDYIINNRKPTEIHLWGFDSMFSTDLTSAMDETLPRPNRPPLNNEWRPHWHTIMAKDSSIQYVLHIPKGKTSEVKAPNLTVQEHS
jgi:hypothetical protein